MGRVATCADNAAMESLFALLQKNVLNRRRWTTRDELRLAIITWIEKTYHRRRPQDILGRLTPIEFETLLPAAPGLPEAKAGVNRTGCSPPQRGRPSKWAMFERSSSLVPS